MGKVIGLPDGTQAEFPDSMSDADIKGVLAKKFPPPVKGDDYGDTKSGSVMQFLGGAKHAWDKAAEALQSGAGAIGLPTGEPLKPLVEKGKKYVEETGPASTVGNIAGEVLLTAAPAARAAQAVNATARFAPSVLTRTRSLVGGGAAAGAAGAATMGEDPAMGAASGAAFGPLVHGAGRLADAGWRGLQNITGGASGRVVRELQQTFGDRAAQAAETLRNLRGYLPGEAPTAGAAASTSLPELKILEEAARTRPGAHHFLQRDEANQAARVAPLDEMAHPGQRYFNPQTRRTELSEAEINRATATDPLYAAANQQRVGLTPEVEAVMGGPEASAALRAGGRSLDQAQVNAAGREAPIPGGRTEAIPPAPAPVREFTSESGDFGQPYRATEPFVPVPATRTIDELQRVRSNLDQQIKILSRSTDEAAPLKLAQAQDARRQITAAMEQSGDYNVANTVFRNMSAPQNQADIANVLRRSLRSPAGVERESSFLSALDNAPQTIKKSDLSPRFQNIGEVMTPEQMGTIGNVKRSVQREADYARLPATGIVPESIGPLQRLEEHIPGFLSRGVTALKTAIRHVSGQSDEQVQRLVDDAMLHPDRLAALIEGIPPEARNATINQIREFMAIPGVASAATGFVGAQQ